jgi:hypothetical protein
MLVNFAMMARSVLFNGLGRYSEACACARHAFERDHFGYETLCRARAGGGGVQDR